jgi:hypothetical protein
MFDPQHAKRLDRLDEQFRFVPRQLNHFDSCPERLADVTSLPRRPDASVLNETIPLYFVGKNKSGFWVARDTQGRRGGIFLFKRSALNFARKRSDSAGCATMLLAEPLELDIQNQGSRFVVLLAAAMDFAVRRAPPIVTFAVLAVAGGRRCVWRISRALAAERRNREVLERELFRGQYTLASKNDDDLRVP